MRIIFFLSGKSVIIVDYVKQCIKGLALCCADFSNNFNKEVYDVYADVFEPQPINLLAGKTI